MWGRTMGKLEDYVQSQRTPVYRATYGDVRDYYVKQYGEKGYRGALAMALSGAESKKDKAYLAARRSIERVEKGQYKGFAAKYAAKVPEVGQKLGPDHYIPKGNITVRIKGGQVTAMEGGRPKGHRDREYKAAFNGGDAYAFVNEPTEAEMLADILRYNDYPEDVVEDMIEEGGDYELDIFYAAAA